MMSDVSLALWETVLHVEDSSFPAFRRAADPTIISIIIIVIVSEALCLIEMRHSV